MNPLRLLILQLVGEVLGVMRDFSRQGRLTMLSRHTSKWPLHGVMSLARLCFSHQGVVEEEGNPEKIFTTQSQERFKQFISSVY